MLMTTVVDVSLWTAVCYCVTQFAWHWRHL